MVVTLTPRPLIPKLYEGFGDHVHWCLFRRCSNFKFNYDLKQRCSEWVLDFPHKLITKTKQLDKRKPRKRPNCIYKKISYLPVCCLIFSLSIKVFLYSYCSPLLVSGSISRRKACLPYLKLFIGWELPHDRHKLTTTNTINRQRWLTASSSIEYAVYVTIKFKFKFPQQLCRQNTI